MLECLAKEKTLGHCNNTYKDFIYNDLTYNINKCNITYVFYLLLVKSFISKMKYK